MEDKINEIKEDLITLKTARLVRQKILDPTCTNIDSLNDFNYFYVKPNCKMFGIDERGNYYKIKRSTTNVLYKVGEYATLNIENVYPVCSQSLIQKILMECFNIYIEIRLNKVFKSDYDFYYSICKKKNGLFTTLKSDFSEYSYIKTLEKAIQEALELL